MNLLLFIPRLSASTHRSPAVLGGPSANSFRSTVFAGAAVVPSPACVDIQRPLAVAEDHIDPLFEEIDGIDAMDTKEAVEGAAEAPTPGVRSNALNRLPQVVTSWTRSPPLRTRHAYEYDAEAITD